MNRERIAELEADYLEEHPGTAGTVEPFVPENPEVFRSEDGRFPFPILTDILLSEDWEAAGEIWFVDSFGGDECGPALSQGLFREQLLAYALKHPEHGYGLSGVGQFQVYVAAYRRKD